MQALLLLDLRLPMRPGKTSAFLPVNFRCASMIASAGRRIGMRSGFPLLVGPERPRHTLIVIDLASMSIHFNAQHSPDLIPV